MKSDAEIAKALYGRDEPEEEVTDQVAEATEEAEKEAPKARTDAELAEVLYGPPHDPRYPKIDTNGTVEDIVRDIDGRILLRGFVDGRPEALLSRNPGLLSHADLHGMQLPDLPKADLREANARGATLGDVSGADLRGIDVDSNTDIGNANFAGAKIDSETYNRLTQCKGFRTARALGRPLRSG